MAICIRCGEFFPDERKMLGFNRCMPCNTKYAKAESEMKFSMVIPSNKSTPTYISNPELLKQLNPKRTT
jgi:predicted  nucleic acid-binding Zn-ribbon protein